MPIAALALWALVAAAWALASRPLGRYLVRVLNGEATVLDPWLSGIEHLWMGRAAGKSRSWAGYVAGAAAASLVGGWLWQLPGPVGGAQGLVADGVRGTGLLLVPAASVAVAATGLRALGGRRPGAIVEDLLRLLTRLLFPLAILAALALAAAGDPGRLALMEACGLLAGRGIPAAIVGLPAAANLVGVVGMGLLPLAVFYSVGPLTGNRALGRALTLLMGLGFAALVLVLAATAGDRAGMPTAWGPGGTLLRWAASSTLGAGRAGPPGGGGAQVAWLAGRLSEVIGGAVGAGLLPLMGLLVLVVVVVSLMKGHSPRFMGRPLGRHDILAGAVLYGMRPVLVLGALALLAGFGREPPAPLLSVLAHVARVLGSWAPGAAPWNGGLQLAGVVAAYVPWAAWIALVRGWAQGTPRLRADVGLGTTAAWLAALASASLVMTALLFLPVLALAPVVGGGP